MKKLLLLFSLGSFLFFNAANAQIDAPTPLLLDPNTGLPIPPPPEPDLPRFNLSFPGGTPKELARAIEKATGKQINVIIPEKNSAVLPELQLKNVTMLELSEALKLSSQKLESYQRDSSSGTMMTSYFFKTAPHPTENSIWVFYEEQPTLPPPPALVCHFYQLGPLLESGYKVDDITTAVETGWKMLGITNSSRQLNYHKDTKLLIAVGEADALTLIDQVLRQLSATPKDDPYAAQTKGDNAKPTEKSAP